MVHPPSTKPLPAFARGSRLLYILLAAFFTLGVIVQVFLAGLGMLVNPSYFVWHETFAHVLEFVPLLMLLFGLGARLQKQTLLLTSLLIVLVAFQYVFLYLAPQLGLMTLRALHAVNALALFWLGMYLARTVWQHHQATQHDLHLHHTLRQQELKEGKRVS